MSEDGTVTPACMTPAEYALWSQANRRLYPHTRAPRPCRDCPADYREDQAKAGRCDLYQAPPALPPLPPTKDHRTVNRAWHRRNGRTRIILGPVVCQGCGERVVWAKRYTDVEPRWHNDAGLARHVCAAREAVA